MTEKYMNESNLFLEFICVNMHFNFNIFLKGGPLEHQQSV